MNIHFMKISYKMYFYVRLNSFLLSILHVPWTDYNFNRLHSNELEVQLLTTVNLNHLQLSHPDRDIASKRDKAIQFQFKPV